MLDREFGKAIAIALAREGADATINFLASMAAAEDFAGPVRAAGRRAELVPGDVAAAGTPGDLAAATVAAFGKIDILVNNAGVFPSVPFLDMTGKDWDLVHSINLKGGFFCGQAAARAMIAAGLPGTIINIASASVFGTSPHSVHYAASKGGGVSMTRAMALEVARWKIRVNAIAPGLAGTAQPRRGSTEEEPAVMAAAIPLGRMGPPEDIAKLAVFLASGKSAFMTGQTVRANGGAFMTTWPVHAPAPFAASGGAVPGGPGGGPGGGRGDGRGGAVCAGGARRVARGERVIGRPTPKCGKSG